MNERRLALAERRGALTAKLAMQRAALAANTAPLETILGAADQAAAGVTWVKQRPAIVVGAVAVLVALRPSRVWRWGRRAWMLSQAFRGLRGKLRGAFL